MVCGTFKIRDLTKADADALADSYRANDPKPTSVTITQSGTDADGNATFTVVATFPPCPSSTTFSKKGAVAAN